MTIGDHNNSFSTQHNCNVLAFVGFILAYTANLIVVQNLLMTPRGQSWIWKFDTFRDYDASAR